ncbi:hypothetical protein C8J57DRAFT_208965 [Mycena rebaudengoi]|nr:hypothetical protein C8J57DRAFT_208965 [Mycena rebaudengoi]
MPSSRPLRQRRPPRPVFLLLLNARYPQICPPTSMLVLFCSSPFVTIGLSWILYAKSFFSGGNCSAPRHGPASSPVENSPTASSSLSSAIPPSFPPPLDTGSETEPIPPGKRTNWLYIVILFLLLLLFSVYILHRTWASYHFPHVPYRARLTDHRVLHHVDQVSRLQKGPSYLRDLKSRFLEDRLLVFLPLAASLHLTAAILLTRLGCWSSKSWRYLRRADPMLIPRLLVFATVSVALACKHPHHLRNVPGVSVGGVRVLPQYVSLDRRKTGKVWTSSLASLLSGRDIDDARPNCHATIYGRRGQFDSHGSELYFPPPKSNLPPPQSNLPPP